jgi:hypothetical protein
VSCLHLCEAGRAGAEGALLAQVRHSPCKAEPVLHLGCEKDGCEGDANTGSTDITAIKNNFDLLPH